MSTFWIIVIVVFVFGIIVGNLLLVKYSNKFVIPKDFKKRPDSDYDGDDKKDDW
jgi:uncharacterized membrane-anchored protein YhcB (DUF1043 family)